MSHLSVCKAIVTDLDAIAEAAKKLDVPSHWKRDYPDFKIEFMRDQKTFNWYSGNKGNCDHVIRLSFGKSYVYEVGLVPRKDGTGWELQYDNGMTQILGADASKLMALYSEEVCNKYAQDTGSMLEKEELPDGNLRISMAEHGTNKKVIAIIDKKTGVNTVTCEGGEGGGQCLIDTSPLEQRLGMREPERTMLPEYYNKVDQVQDNQVGGS